MRLLHAREGNVLAKVAGLCSERRRPELWVHVDVDSAMNGITQFVYDDGAAEAEACEEGWRWRYDKTEGLGDAALAQFDYAVSERRRLQGFCVVAVQAAFVRVDWRHARLQLEDHTFVHRNVNLTTQGCLPPQEA